MSADIPVAGPPGSPVHRQAPTLRLQLRASISSAVWDSHASCGLLRSASAAAAAKPRSTCWPTASDRSLRSAGPGRLPHPSTSNEWPRARVCSLASTAGRPGRGSGAREVALSARQASMKDIDGTAGLPRPVPEVGGSVSWALCSSSPARCSSRHSACIPNREMYVAREPA